jgi:hypothetical protein
LLGDCLWKFKVKKIIDNKNIVKFLMSNIRCLFIGSALVVFLSSIPVQAVPLLLNFQGRVTVDGTVFTGNGQFKFALVNGDGTQSYWSNDGSSIDGLEPTTAVDVSVVNGNYSLHLGDSSLTNMVALSVAVFANDPIFLRIWFSDGTNGFELLGTDHQITSVAFALKAKEAETVTSLPAGLVTEANLATALTAKLADLQSQITTLEAAITANTAKVGYTDALVSANSDVTANTAKTVITTTQANAITANTAKVGYTDALVSANSDVTANTAKTVITTTQANAITANTAKVGYTDALVSANSDVTANTAKTVITTTQANAITANTAKTGITSGQANAIAANTANIGSGGSGGSGGGSTAAGSVVTSASSSDSGLAGDGYVKFLSIAADSWSASPGTELLSGRVGHGSAWTGSTMSIWGGALGSGTYLSTGAIYDPATDTWASITPRDAPDARSDHSIVWSGTELIVWGGYGSSGLIADGGRYQASNQSWLPLNSTGAPSERYNNAAVWTGTRMLIWGGLNNTGILNDGAVYDPGTDTWTAVAPSGGPAARHSGAAVLAGDSVIIWGGKGATGAMNDGAILNLSNGEPTAWSAIATSGAPSARSGHAAAWTGSKLIVWGGLQGGTHLSDGAIYGPAVGQDGTWTAMSTTGAPAARENHAAVWTGSELVVIGGDGTSGELSDSHAYNPATDTWRSLSGSTGARSGSSSEWTGSQILIFGGESDGQKITQPMEIDPTPPVHLYRKQ